MRNLSISTCFNYDIPIEEQLALIGAAGFNHVSLGADHRHSGILSDSGVQTLRALLERHGLKIDTIHGVTLDRDDALDRNLRVAQAAKALAVRVIVVHCSGFDIDASTLEREREHLLGLLPQYEELSSTYHIRFALENVMPGPATDLLADVLSHADPRVFGFCYDSSHDQIDGPRPFDLLADQAHRLIAVHLSDRIREFVDHVIPGEGFIAFDRLSGLLQRAHPDLPLLLEVMMEHSRYREPHAFLTAAYEKACELSDEIQLPL